MATCPQLAPEVHNFLQAQAEMAREKRPGRSDPEAPCVAAISDMIERYVTMSDADLNFAALKSNMLVASGSAVHTIRNVDFFVSMVESKTWFIRPVGGEQVCMLGKGTIQFALDTCTDQSGEVHNVVLEIPTVCMCRTALSIYCPPPCLLSFTSVCTQQAEQFAHDLYFFQCNDWCS